MAKSGIGIVQTATDLIFANEVQFHGFTVAQPPVELIAIGERDRWRALILKRLSVPTPEAPGPIEFDPKERHPAYVAMGCRTLREYNARTTHYTLCYNDTKGFAQGPAVAKGSQQGFNFTQENTIEVPVDGKSPEAIAAELLRIFEGLLEKQRTHPAAN